MTQNRVRIVDVADALGLSTATVSKVIHGKTEKISDKTVKCVQQELERSGYIPNMAGILLARNYCYRIYLMYQKRWRYTDIVSTLKKITIRDYLIMILPILISEFLWSLGQNVESAVYGHLGTSNLAAYTLTGPIQGLIVGALSGLSAAAGVMVGKRLGRKEYDEAYTESKKIMYAGLFGAVTVSALLILLAGVYTGLYRVDDSVKELGKILLIIFALYAPVKVENMILGGGIIRSGGNTKIIMIIDIVGTWCIGIPLCLLAAYVFKWGIVGVYTLLTTEELFRLAVSLIIFRKRKWIISFC